MTTITIIGTGNMGQAISGVLSKGGATVEMLGSADTDKPVTGDIVVLAVPYPALSEVFKQRQHTLADRIVVDITNPVNFETFDSLTVPSDSSATAEIAAALPLSRVIKAFNTTFAATLVSGEVGPLTTTVLIAGDDAAAKRELAELIAAADLRALDVGGLARARELEAFGFLQISLAAAEKVPWTGGFGVVR